MVTLKAVADSGSVDAPHRSDGAPPARAPLPALTATELRWFHQRARALAPVLIAIVRRHLGDDAEASDLVQTTFECALRDFRKFDPSKSFRAWLTRILTHRLLRLLRDRRRPVDLVADWDGLEEALPAGADQEPEPSWRHLGVSDLLGAIARLPAALREPLHLHMVKQIPYREIAARLSIPSGTVASRLSRARQQLRAMLRGDPAEKRR